MQTVYLDSSSIVKRYVHEAGSEVADLVYGKAENGTDRIIMSLWNVGEVLGVLDRYRSRKFLDNETLLKTVGIFLSESEKMVRLGGMQILPLALNILTETYYILIKHHIYEADALQVASCKISQCNLFLSADSELISVARSENIEALNIETDENEIRNRLIRA